MPDLFNAQAADATVAGVLTPARDDLPKLLSAWRGPRPLLVCSGGTSSRCAAAHHWTLDLRRGFRTMAADSDGMTIRIGAGCQMGDVLDNLAVLGRTVPAGLSGLPGVGYVLTGGMGPLANRYGLAIDQLLQIRGVWGNGEPFALECADDPRWQALCGAAVFFAVVTDVTLKTVPLASLWIERSIVSPMELATRIAAAEDASERASLQWHWESEQRVRLLRVSHGPVSGAERIDGLHRLPPFAPPPQSHERLHAEVVGLLGPAASADWTCLLPELTALMRKRPHPACSLSAQQLGGATGRVPVPATAFVHRDAMWKPWVTTVWPAGDRLARDRSLLWLEEVWSLLEPICPWVHLAQLHHHLPFHQRELALAFGERLEPLRTLKARLDPDGNLPSL